MYEGNTHVSGGSINLDMKQKTEVSGVVGISNVIVLDGGTLKTTNAQNENYENYRFDIVVPEGTTGGFAPYRNCYIKSKVLGSGTLKLTIPYLREYIEGDWSEFTGMLNAYGTNSADSYSLFLLNNSEGLPNTRVNLTGNTKAVKWSTNGTMRLGGLSGNVGTYLGSSSKRTNGSTMTWIVGGAGTDETFRGIINNDCAANGYYGVTSIVKEGTGIWRLTGRNVYSGTTIINDGVLIVNGNNTGTGTITVNEGGTLSGKGRVYGSVIIKSGGRIAPGDETISTFYTSNNIIMYDDGAICSFEVNGETKTNDKISSTKSITYNGTLQLDTSGTFNIGDKFTLFTASSHFGSFDEIIPATPGEGMYWRFSNGVLSVSQWGVGISDNSLSDNVAVSPNPVKDIAHILFDANSYDEVIIRVRSVEGKKIVDKFIDGNSVDIDMSSYPNGLYFIELKSDDRIIGASKLLKE